VTHEAADTAWTDSGGMMFSIWSPVAWFTVAALCATIGLIALRLDTRRYLVDETQDEYDRDNHGTDSHEFPLAENSDNEFGVHTYSAKTRRL
jgi:hypothetical protein